MPTSREDALRAARERDQKPYGDFRDLVEKAIAERAGTPLQITVNIGSTPRQVIDRIVEDYRAIGWACEVVPDQRDGDYVHLS